MKKITAVLLSLSILLFCGCSHKADGQLVKIIDNIKIEKNILTSSMLNMKITLPGYGAWMSADEIRKQIAPTMEQSDYENTMSSGAFLAMTSGSTDTGEFTVSIYAVKSSSSLNDYINDSKKDSDVGNVKITYSDVQDKKIGNVDYKYLKANMKYTGTEQNPDPNYGKMEFTSETYYTVINGYIVSISVMDGGGAVNISTAS